MSAQGMIPSGPAVRLRSDVARQPERYARIDAYLKRRDDRHHRDYLAAREAERREAERFVPCALCGGATEPWDRLGLHPSIVICGAHTRRMAGNFPFARAGGVHGAIPREVNEPFFAARVALHSFEQTMKERAHGQAY